MCLNLFPDEAMTLQVPRLGDEHHRHCKLLHRFNKGTNPQAALAVGDVPDLAGRSELIVGELNLKRLDHPSGKALLNERQDRLESVSGCQPSAGHGVNMSPVNDRAHERKFGSQLGNIPDSPERVGVACCFQTHPNPKRLDLGSDMVEP